MSQFDQDEDDDKSFFQRYRVGIVIGVLVLAGGGFAVKQLAGGKGGAPKPSEGLTMIKLPPLPPPPTPIPTPPPPPPKDQPTPEEAPKMMEQVPVTEPEVKPEPEQEAKAPDEPMGTNNPPGEDGFGLRRGVGGSRIGGNRSGGRVSSSKFGWYASQVQSTIQQALQNNPKTRSASLRLQVRIWADSSGHITRATLGGSTGDPALDEALKSQVLNGLKLQEAPPKDMPMPIVMRITGRRPN